MPWGFASHYYAYAEPRPAKVGRPDRGDRAKVKAARKAGKRR